MPSVNLIPKWTLKLFRKIVKTHHSYLDFHVWFLNLEAVFSRIFFHDLSICRETTRGKAIRLWISEEFSYTQALTSPLPLIWFFYNFSSLKSMAIWWFFFTTLTRIIANHCRAYIWAWFSQISREILEQNKNRWDWLPLGPADGGGHCCGILENTRKKAKSKAYDATFSHEKSPKHSREHLGKLTFRKHVMVRSWILVFHTFSRRQLDGDDDITIEDFDKMRENLLQAWPLAEKLPFGTWQPIRGQLSNIRAGSGSGHSPLRRKPANSSEVWARMAAEACLGYLVKISPLPTKNGSSARRAQPASWV